MLIKNQLYSKTIPKAPLDCIFTHARAHTFNECALSEVSQFCSPHRLPFFFCFLYCLASQPWLMHFPSSSLPAPGKSSGGWSKLLGTCTHGGHQDEAPGVRGYREGGPRKHEGVAAPPNRHLPHPSNPSHICTISPM